MKENTTQPAQPGLGRRNIVKGAAWSVPVIAAAVSAPAAAASTVQSFDVAVTSSCVGGVDSLLGLDLGLTAFGDPTFAITAATGTIPAGSTFILTTDALVTADVLGYDDTLLEAEILADGSVVLTTLADITEGSTQTFSVIVDDSALTADLLGDYTLTYTSSPAGSTESGTEPNSATVSNTQTTLGAATVIVCVA